MCSSRFVIAHCLLFVLLMLVFVPDVLLLLVYAFYLLFNACFFSWFVIVNALWLLFVSDVLFFIAVCINSYLLFNASFLSRFVIVIALFFLFASQCLFLFQMCYCYILVICYNECFVPDLLFFHACYLLTMLVFVPDVLLSYACYLL